MKKTIIIWVLIILIASTFLFFFNWFSGTGSVFADSYQVLDDFETGLRGDIWDIEDDSNILRTTGDLITVDNGEIILREQLWSSYGKGSKLSHSSITSKKKFETEDIKIIIRGGLERRDGRDARASPISFKPALFYGDVEIPLRTNTCDGSGPSDRIKSCGLPAQIIEIKRYDDFDPNKYVIIRDGIELSTERNEGPESIKIKGGTLAIEEIKFQNLVSCEIKTDVEVRIRDNFASGSIIDVDELTYKPTKFCIDDLGVIIINEDGIRTEKGSITRNLKDGKTVTVPQGESYAIRYITKYVTDMKERCDPIDEEYDTNLKGCIPTGVQQQLPTQEILFCEETSDCILPQKCEDAIVQCTNNQCDYTSAVCTPEQIINYIEVIKTIEVEQPKYIIIPEAQNEITFQTELGLRIADQEWKINNARALKSKPECQIANGEFLSPSNKGCYAIDVVWADMVFTIENGESKKINDFVTVLYELEGRGVFVGGDDRCITDGDPPEFRSCDYEFVNVPKHIFKITFTNALEIEIINYKEKVLLNAPLELNFRIKNNLFDLKNSGFTVSIIKGITQETLPTERISRYFFKGDNAYSQKFPTETLSSHIVEITPTFEMIAGKDYFSPKRLQFGYFVLEDAGVLGCDEDSDCSIGKCINRQCIVTEVTIQDCNVKECDEGICNKETGNCEIETLITPNVSSFWIIIGVLLLIVVVLVIVVVLIKKK